MNRFPVNPEYAETFETRVANRPRQVENRPGFIDVNILRPSNLDDPYIVMTRWQSKADYEAWVNDPEFTAKHAGKRTLTSEVFRGPNRVETFETFEEAL